MVPTVIIFILPIKKLKISSDSCTFTQLISGEICILKLFLCMCVFILHRTSLQGCQETAHSGCLLGREMGEREVSGRGER